MAELTEIFVKLRSLQEVLSEEFVLKEEIEEAPKRLSSQEELLSRYKKEFISTSAEYDETSARYSKLKIELQDVIAQREKSEKAMDNITTHREYEALSKEISEAKEKEQTLRKECQIQEKAKAELNDKLNRNQEMVKVQEEELNSGKAKLDNEIASSKAKLENLKAKKQELEKDIDPELIFKFSRIVKSKHNKGIVAVRGNVCDGCHMILPNQFANDVHNGESIVFCPYCSRILYYEDTNGEDEQFYSMEETGSLDMDDYREEEDFDDGAEEDTDEEEKDTVKELDF